MQVLTSLDDPRLPRLLEEGEFFWLDLESPRDEDVVRAGELFGLHRLAVEDSLEFGQRPKFDDYGDNALIVFYGVEHGGTLAEVHLHVSGSWLLTVHRAPCTPLKTVSARVEKEPPRTEEEAIYRVLDALADSFFPALEPIDEEIDALMGEMIDRPTDRQRERLFELRRRLVELRRIAAPQRDLLARGDELIGGLPGLEADEARDWFRDLYDHMLRVAEMIDAYRDLLHGALDVYLSTVSNRLNQISKQLTIVATIFLPLTFITGFFGQNFGTLVRHINGPAAFWGYGVGSMLVSALILLWYFRRAGFLGD